MQLSEKQIQNEYKLSDRYDFLRRSLISYYTKCRNVDISQQKHFFVPFHDFYEMMKFYENMYYKFLREEYKDDNR